MRHVDASVTTETSCSARPIALRCSSNLFKNQSLFRDVNRLRIFFCVGLSRF